MVRGIQYVTDSHGRKVAVQIDLKRHGALWEDFADVLAAEARRGEKGIPLATAKKMLARAAKHRG